MIWQCVGQAKTHEPPDRDVNPGLAHRAPMVDDPDQETGQHGPQCHLGVYAGPTSAVSSVPTPAANQGRGGTGNLDRRLILLCHKTLLRFSSLLVRMEILTRGGGLWVSDDRVPGRGVGGR